MRYLQLKIAVFGPYLRRAVGKIVGKKTCDVNVGQVKKKREIQNRVFRVDLAQSGLCGHKPGKNRQFVFKSCKLWL